MPLIYNLLWTVAVKSDPYKAHINALVVMCSVKIFLEDRFSEAVFALRMKM